MSLNPDCIAKPEQTILNPLESTNVAKGFKFVVANYRSGLGLAELLPVPSGLKLLSVTKGFPQPDKIEFEPPRWSTCVTKGFKFAVASYTSGLGLADLVPGPSGLKLCGSALLDYVSYDCSKIDFPILD